MPNTEQAAQLSASVDQLSQSLSSTLQAMAELRIEFEKNTRELDERGRKNRLFIIMLAVTSLLLAIGVSVGVYLWITVRDNTDQLRCINNLRAQSSSLRSSEMDNLYDILNKAIAGKLKTPAEVKAAEQHFQQVYRSDQAQLAAIGVSC